MTRPDDGFATVQLVTAAGLALVVFAVLANVVVLGYARGVVRAALDEGVRLGARAPDPQAACEQLAGQALDDLLGGDLRGGVAGPTCVIAGDQVIATATVHWEPLAPGLTAWSYRADATALLEEVPDPP